MKDIATGKHVPYLMRELVVVYGVNQSVSLTPQLHNYLCHLCRYELDNKQK